MYNKNNKLGSFSRGLLSSIASCTLLAGTWPNTVFANPIGGQVSAGQAQINSNGNSLTINQQTGKAVIDWRGFDIAPNETTHFLQPSTASMTLNRVNSMNPSQILGTVTANGNITIVNQNGVFFGKGSHVDVGGMIATTANISNQDFMAGRMNFFQPGNPDARIVNQGTITARNAGLIGLVAPQVENSGIINARMGTVALGSGDVFALDLYGDDLISLGVSGQTKSRLIDNSGLIEADGGKVLITAAAAHDVVNSLINISGDVKATRIDNQGGVISIYAAGKDGNTGTALVSGTLDATGNKQGGTITVTGDHVGILNGSTVNASGKAGGGRIHVGGEYLGKGLTPHAKSAVIEKNATLKANGGNGEVIAWSDDYTNFSGHIEANGGGGFVETSSKNILQASGYVDAESGQWLLDPGDITIQDDAGGAPDDTNTLSAVGPLFQAPVGTNSIVTTQAILAALAGADVTVRTGNTGGNNGDITINNAINYTGGAARNLTFEAYRDIVVNDDITSSVAALNIVLNSRYDGASAAGRVEISSSWVLSHGGNITIGGAAGAAGYAQSGIGIDSVYIYDSTLDAAGGNIAMRGRNDAAEAGIYLNSSHLATINTGTVLLDAIANNTVDCHCGMAAGNSTISTQDGQLRMIGNGSTSLDNTDISSTTGEIRIEGYGNGTGHDKFGVIMDSSGITTNSGQINLIGIGGNANTGNDAMGLRIVNNSSITSTAAAGTPGAITLTGTGGSNGNYLAGILVDNSPITSGFADITITGVAGVGTSDNYGIGLFSGSPLISSQKGNIYIDGTGRGTGFSNSGVRIDSTIQTTGATKATAGTITVIGQGSTAATGDNATGVDMYGGNINTVAGDITLNGTGGSGNHDNRGTRIDGGRVSTTGTGADAARIDITGVSANATGNANYAVVLRTNGDVVKTGDGAINITGTIQNTLSGNGAAAIYADNNAVISSTNGAITMAGTSHATGGNSEGVLLNSTNVRTTGTGAISITGSGGSVNNGNHGIRTNSATINTTQGAITLAGTAGSGADDNYGLLLENNALGDVLTSQTGNILATGTSSGTGAHNHGVLMVGSSITSTGAVKASAATITVRGTASAVSANNENKGLEINSATITSAAGDIVLEGTGGAGTGDNMGIDIHNNGSLISTTGAGANAASILMTGVSRSSTGGGNHAVRIETSGDSVKTVDGAITIGGTAQNTVNQGVGIFTNNNTIISSTNGAIAMTGTSNATGGSNEGVTLLSTNVRTTGTGTITMTGTGGTAGTGNDGIRTNSATINTTQGAITLTGTGGNGTNDNYGLFLEDNALGDVVTSQTGNILVEGFGHGTGDANHGIRVSNASISSTGATKPSAATITMRGTGSGTATGGFNNGLSFSNATITSVAGNVLLEGTSGSGNGGETGIGFDSGTTVTTTGAGPNAASITMTGISHDATGNDNTGIRLDVNGDVVKTADGAINMSGTVQNTVTADLSRGIYISNNGTISSTNGAIDITGTGKGTNDGTGIYIESNSGIRTTSATAGQGNISVTGTGNGGNNTRGIMLNATGNVIQTSAGMITLNGTGATTGDNTSGIQLDNTGDILSVNGNISVTGTSRSAAGSDSAGILFNDSNGIKSTNGNISVSGTSVSNNTNSHAVYLTAGSDITTTGTGAISLTGNASNNDDIHTSNAANSVTSNGGTVTLTADDIDLGDNVTSTAGTIVLQNRTAGTAVNIGSGAPAGGLNMTNAEMGRLTAANYIFGSTTAGNIEINTNKNFAATNNNVTLISNAIATASGAIATGSGNMTIQSNGAAINANLTGTGNLTVRENTAGTLIGLGTGAGALSLSDPELNRMLNWANIVFGGGTALDGTSGNVDIATGHDFGNSNVTVYSGGNIALNSAWSSTGTGDTIFDADNAVNFNNSFTVSGVGASLIANADGTIGIGGDITTRDGIIINNAVLATTTGNRILDGGTGNVTTALAGINTGANDFTLTGANIAANGNINGTGTLSLTATAGNVSMAAGTLTATDLNLDATGTIIADINATNVDIHNNSTTTTLTGLVGGAATQAAANSILGGPGNDPLYRFAGLIIRDLSTPPPPPPGGGGGSGPVVSNPPVVSAPTPPTTPIRTPVIPASLPVSNTVAFDSSLISLITASPSGGNSGSFAPPGADVMLAEQRLLTTRSELSFFVTPENQPYEFEPGEYSSETISTSQSDSSDEQEKSEN